MGTTPDNEPFVDLVQIRAVGAFGTGLLVGRGLVLTALHCVRNPDQGWAVRDDLGVYLLRELQHGEERSYTVRIVWPRTNTFGEDPPDVAVLQIVDAAPPKALVRHRFGELPLNPADGSALGFPKATSRGHQLPGGRIERNQPGRVTYSCQTRPTLTIDATGRHEVENRERWAGISGGPLLINQLIVGVMRNVPEHWHGEAVEAEPLAPLLRDKEDHLLRSLLGVELPLHDSTGGRQLVTCPSGDIGAATAGSAGLHHFNDVEYQLPDPAESGELARYYLHGAQPTFFTANRVAVSQTVVHELARLVDRYDVTIILGPVAEGKSTILLQLAHHLLHCGRDVYQAYNIATLNMGPPSNTVAGKTTVLFDDGDSLEALPGWLLERAHRGLLGSLVLVAHRHSSRKLSGILRNKVVFRPYDLPPISPKDAGKFIAAITKWGASQPGISSARLQSLFLDGLSLPHGLGGLWPAQYQATRGVHLDERIRDLVGGLDDAEQVALSAVAFISFLAEKAPPWDDGLEPSRHLVQTLLRELDREPADLERAIEALSRLPARLEGEFLGAFSSNYLRRSQAVLWLRHPALAECIFRWLFGAEDSGRGEFLFCKWDYYPALVSALSQIGSLGPSLAVMVAQILKRNLIYDSDRKRLKAHIPPGNFGDPLIALLRHARAVFGNSVDGSDRTSRLAWVTLGEAHILRGRKRTPEDVEEAIACIDRVIDAAITENDTEIIIRVARIAAETDYRVKVIFDENEVPSGWRELLDYAHRIQKKWVGSHATSAAVTYFEFALRDHREETLPQLISAAHRAQLLEDDETWDHDRLSTLRSLLKWVRPIGPNKRIRLRLPYGMPDDSLSSLRSIYKAFWQELYRLKTTRKDFANLNAFRSGQDGSVIRDIIRATLADWADDEEERDDGWPTGVVDAVIQARDDKSKWLPFIDSYSIHFDD